MQKIKNFDKIYQKSVFVDSIGLIHQVSENIGSGGHFGVFTTHISHFGTEYGPFEDAGQRRLRCYKIPGRFLPI